MNFLCIGDEDTARGFRLAGVDAVVALDARTASAALSTAVSREDCGVVVISREVADLIRPELERTRQERSRPLIAEVEQFRRVRHVRP